nr:hypothetical protein K-LCC10_0104 [Kaumoebavirus]
MSVRDLIKVGLEKRLSRPTVTRGYSFGDWRGNWLQFTWSSWSCKPDGYVEIDNQGLYISYSFFAFSESTQIPIRIVEHEKPNAEEIVALEEALDKVVEYLEGGTFYRVEKKLERLRAVCPPSMCDLPYEELLEALALHFEAESHYEEAKSHFDGCKL